MYDDLDWFGAEAEFRQAIELGPNNASAHEAYESLLLCQGRVAEAIAEIQRAQELDPFSFEIYQAKVISFYYARRYDKFIKGCQQWVEREPQQGWIYHHCLGLPTCKWGSMKRRSRSFEKLKSSTLFAHTTTELANALAVADKCEDALKLLGQGKSAPCRSFGAALVYTGLREKDETFRWLRKAIELRAPSVGPLKVDPRFDPLLQDTRFKDLLRLTNLPE